MNFINKILKEKYSYNIYKVIYNYIIYNKSHILIREISNSFNYYFITNYIIGFRPIVL
jgi:hypothetical protein